MHAHTHACKLYACPAAKPGTADLLARHSPAFCSCQFSAAASPASNWQFLAAVAGSQQVPGQGAAGAVALAQKMQQQLAGSA